MAPTAVASLAALDCVRLDWPLAWPLTEVVTEVRIREPFCHWCLSFWVRHQSSFVPLP